MAVIEKDGRTFDIPDSQLAEAAERGYRVLSSEQVARADARTQAATRPNIARDVAAFGESAAASLVDAAIAPAKAAAAATTASQRLLGSAVGAALGATEAEQARARADQAQRVGSFLRDMTGSERLGVDVASAVADGEDPVASVIGRLSGRQLVGDVAGIAGGGYGDTAEAAREEYDAAARQRAKDAPGAALLGSVAGTLASIPLTGGGVTSLATKGTGLAARLGLAMADGALSGFGAADEAAWLRGDARPKAEDIVAAVGLGGLLGGGMGALGEAGGSLWRRATSGWTQDVALTAERAAERAAGDVAGAGERAAVGGLGDAAAEQYARGAAAMLGDSELAPTIKRGLTSREFRDVVADPTAASQRAAKELGSDLEIIERESQRSLDTFREMKKPEIEAALSRGGGLAATDQVRTAQALATEAVGEMREAVSTLAARGEKDLARYMRDVPKLTEQRIAAASTPAEAFLALDQTKRELQTLVKGAREKLAGTGLTGSQNREVVDALFGEQGAIQSIQERMRLALEDESVWGAAGAAQRERNAAVSEFLALKKDAEKAFKRDVSSDALAVLEGDPSMRSYVTGRRTTGVIDEDKFAANLLRSGRTEQRFTDEVFDRYVGAAEKLAKAVHEHGTGSVVDADSLLAAAQRLQSKRGQYVESMRSFNALQEASEKGGAPWIRSLADQAPLALGLTLGPGGAALGGAISAGVRGLTDPTGAIRAVARLDTVSDLVNRRIGTGVRDMLRASPRQPRQALAAVSRARVGQAVRKGASTGTVRYMRRDQEPSEAYATRASEVERLAANPQEATELLSNSLGAMAERFPALSTELSRTALEAVQFLREKQPAPAKVDTLFGGQEVVVSNREAAKWGRYWTAATDPLAVLDLARVGALEPEHVEALDALYPTLATRVRTAIVEEVRAGKTPYHARVQADRLLGAGGAGEPSVSPQAQQQRIQAAQAVASQPRQTRTPPRLGPEQAPASANLWR